MRERNRAETISVPQLYRMFPDEDSCYEWLERVRWDGEPVCPHCGGLDNVSEPSPSKPHHYWHGDCRKHFTATTKTCMHSTKRPLQDWIYAVYSVMTARKGVSAMQLSKELGCQCRTAWYMLQRVREACDGGAFRLELAGTVEVDETHVGGRRRNMSNQRRKELAGTGRGAVTMTTVVGARQRDGHVVASPVPATDGETLMRFIRGNVTPGSTVYRDGAGAYESRLPEIYSHDSVNHSRQEYVRGDVHTNSVESVWSLLKRAIYGTWHHVSAKHLGRYVNEVAFRLNEGNCEVDTLDRMHSLFQAMGNRRLRYRDLVA